MKKNLFKSLLTMCALGAIFAACSNENEKSVVNNGEKTSAYLQLDLRGKTRAIETPFGANAATVTSLQLYFHDGTNVLKTLSVTNSSTPNIAQLQTGVKITDIPANATKVTVFGNIPTSVSVPTSGTIASVKNTIIEISTQTTASNVLLRGNDADLALVSTYPSPTPPWLSTADGNDKYAEVTIAPAFSRIEIEGIMSDATSPITAYKLEGVFLTNIFTALKLDGTVHGSKETNASDPSKYAQDIVGGTPQYKSSEDGLLHQWTQTNATVSGSSYEVTAGIGKVWGFQVVPNDATNGNDQLQIVLRLSSVTATGYTFSGDKFITVRGFKNSADQIIKLEPGKIYSISKADFTFDHNNLNAVPVTSAVSVWLKVTVKPWEVVTVKPNL